MSSRSRCPNGHRKNANNVCSPVEFDTSNGCYPSYLVKSGNQCVTRCPRGSQRSATGHCKSKNINKQTSAAQRKKSKSTKKSNARGASQSRGNKKSASKSTVRTPRSKSRRRLIRPFGREEDKEEEESDIIVPAVRSANKRRVLDDDDDDFIIPHDNMSSQGAISPRRANHPISPIVPISPWVNEDEDENKDIGEDEDEIKEKMLMEKANALFNIKDNNVRKRTLRTIKRDFSEEDFDAFMDEYDEVFERNLVPFAESGLVGSKQERIDQLRTLKRTTDPKFYSKLIKTIKQGQIDSDADEDNLTDSDFNSI